MDFPAIKKWINAPVIALTVLIAAFIHLSAPGDMLIFAVPVAALFFGIAAAGIILRYIPAGGDITVYLASMPLLVIAAIIMIWLWYAEPAGNAENSRLIQERTLLLSRGMIKDAMYTIHLHAAANRISNGGEYSIEYKDTVTGYSIINSRFETPYNNAGVDIFLDYAGRDSIVLIGESKTSDGADPSYKNRNSRIGKIAFRSVQNGKGISFERIN